MSLGARESLDYFGVLGGNAFSHLTGQPVKVQVSAATGTSTLAGSPKLETSQLELSAGNPADSFTNAPLAYNMTVRVTNSTGHTITGGVTQRVILYDEAGHIVGGGTGSSDNVPAGLPAGASYREQWTGIPAQRPAVSARYTVVGP